MYVFAHTSSLASYSLMQFKKSHLLSPTSNSVSPKKFPWFSKKATIFLRFPVNKPDSWWLHILRIYWNKSEDVYCFLNVTTSPWIVKTVIHASYSPCDLARCSILDTSVRQALRENALHTEKHFWVYTAFLNKFQYFNLFLSPQKFPNMKPSLTSQK